MRHLLRSVQSTSDVFIAKASLHQYGQVVPDQPLPNTHSFCFSSTYHYSMMKRASSSALHRAHTHLETNSPQYSMALRTLSAEERHSLLQLISIFIQIQKNYNTCNPSWLYSHSFQRAVTKLLFTWFPAPSSPLGKKSLHVFAVFHLLLELLSTFFKCLWMP